MNRTVLVRYGELTLKSEPVRKEFRKTLVKNIKSALPRTPNKIKTERGRIFIETSETREVASRISNIPGVVSTSPTRKTNASMEEICELADEVFQKSFPSQGSFAIRARRTGEHEFSSPDLEEKVGAKILKSNSEMSVDLDSPDHELYIEVRGNHCYIFTEIVEGVGGLPVSTQGKVISLFSGKTESIVSTYLMLKRGVSVHPIFLNPSQGKKKPKDKILKLAEKLTKFHPELEFRIVPFKNFLSEISREIDQEIRSIACRRLSLQLAEAVAKKIGAKALISNTSLEEIASHSLKSIQIVEEKVDLPVFHPLAGLKRDRISQLAKEITDSESPTENFDVCSHSYPKPEEIDKKEIRKREKSIHEKDLINSSLESIEVYKAGSNHGLRD